MAVLITFPPNFNNDKLITKYFNQIDLRRTIRDQGVILSYAKYFTFFRITDFKMYISFTNISFK